MGNIAGCLKELFRRNDKSLYLKRKSMVMVGKAFRRLDRSSFLGENVPRDVLDHFSKGGV